MDPNHLIVNPDRRSDIISEEQTWVATTLSNCGNSTCYDDNVAESYQWADLLEVTALEDYSDQNWDERSMGVILMVELQPPLDEEGGWTLQSWADQVNEILNFFIRKTRRAEEYLQKDEVFMNWVVDVEALWHRVSATEQDQAWAEHEDYLSWVLRRTPSKIELRKIPVTSVGVNELEERIVFYQGPVSVGGSDVVAVQLDDVTGPNPDIQRLVRQGMVRRVDAFRVWDVEVM